MEIENENKQSNNFEGNPANIYARNIEKTRRKKYKKQKITSLVLVYIISDKI